jgi:FtsH-binding integral membrane protein
MSRAAPGRAQREANMKKRLAVEALAIVAAMSTAWALIYAPWEKAPSLAVEEALLYLILVAGFIGGILTGSADPGRGSVLAGLIVLALVPWLLVRIALRIRKRST